MTLRAAGSSEWVLANSIVACKTSEHYKLGRYSTAITKVVNLVLRGHLWNKEKWSFKTIDLLRGSIDMKLYMTRQKKCDLSIQITAKAGLTVVCIEH